MIEIVIIVPIAILAIVSCVVWIIPILLNNAEKFNHFIHPNRALRNLKIRSPKTRTEIIKVGRYYISVDIDNE